MKTTLVVALVLVLVASIAGASPYIVCDPQAGVQSYEVGGATWVTPNVPAQPDGSIKMDISGAPVGQSDLTFKACYNDPIWGRYCSASSPFTFTRPTPPVAPKLLKLVP
jgi:hypothetical protein